MNVDKIVPTNDAPEAQAKLNEPTELLRPKKLMSSGNSGPRILSDKPKAHIQMHEKSNDHVVFETLKSMKH